MTDATVDIGGTLHVLPIGRHDAESKQARMLAYVEWVLLPKGQRKPPTKKAVAELLGVSTVTLLNYEKEPDFRGEVQRRLGSVFRVDRLPNVFEALYAQAINPGNPRAVSASRTLMEWSDLLNKSDGIDLSGYSDEELEKARTALGLGDA